MPQSEQKRGTKKEIVVNTQIQYNLPESTTDARERYIHSESFFLWLIQNISNASTPQSSPHSRRNWIK